MEKKSFVACWIVIGLLAAAGGTPAASSDETKAALKRVTKATRDLRGIVADVEYSEIVGEQSIQGSGKLFVDAEQGAVRVEVAGDEPRTILFLPPLLYTHRIASRSVEIYDVTSNPDQLGQYILMGFAITGKALKKRFDVQLVPGSTLDGQPVLNFVLVPKKKDPAAASVARIQLWVDPTSGLPVQHHIVHAGGLSALKIRYRSVRSEDDLPESLFRPEWPPDVRIDRR